MIYIKKRKKINVFGCTLLGFTRHGARHHAVEGRSAILSFLQLHSLDKISKILLSLLIVTLSCG